MRRLSWVHWSEVLAKYLSAVQFVLSVVVCAPPEGDGESQGGRTYLHSECMLDNRQESHVGRVRGT